MLTAPSSRIWIDYDEEADVLYISFRKPQRANDSLLEDNIIYHYRDRDLVGLTGEHPNYVMSINAQKGKKAFVITILVPITQFREPLKIYELPKRLAI